jgi:hypothetical protein
MVLQASSHGYHQEMIRSNEIATEDHELFDRAGESDVNRNNTSNLNKTELD